MRHEDWQAALRKTCSPAVKLPSSGQLRVDGARGAVRICLSDAALASNMQEDGAAAEGWALALLTWGQADNIELHWTPPSNVHEPHYQRFLYRVDKLTHYFPEITISDQSHLRALRLRSESGPFVLNVARGKAARVPSDATEARIEWELARPGHARNVALKAQFGLRLVDRQFPVGVFQGEVRAESAILPGGKSAIDLVAHGSDDSFWVFELKRHDNCRVGALSELFFYTMVIADLQLGRLLPPKQTPGPRACISARDVQQGHPLHARLLVESGGATAPAPVHPLLQDHVFPLLSRRTGIDFAWASLL